MQAQNLSTFLLQHAFLTHQGCPQKYHKPSFYRSFLFQRKGESKVWWSTHMLQIMFANAIKLRMALGTSNVLRNILFFFHLGLNKAGYFHYSSHVGLNLPQPHKIR